MSRARHRPRRGDADSNVLVEGDKGIFGGPQGGAEPGATESGDLAAREYGVPQADIPGGVRHLVNPQTRHARPPGVPERPADYHKEHGVEPHDDGQYVTPPDAIEEKAPKTAPEPRHPADAVPVYVVAGPEAKGAPPLNIVAAYRILIPAAGTIGGRPVPICQRDDKRKGLRLLNEDAAAKIRIHEDEGELSAPSGTNGGAIVPPGATSYLPLQTQQQLWAITDGAAAAYLSVICETEWQGAGG